MPTPAKKPQSASRSHGGSQNVDPNLLSSAPPPRRKPAKSPTSSKVASKPKKSTTATITSKKISCDIVDKDSASEKNKKKTVDEAKRSRVEKASGVAEVEDAVAAEDRKLEGSSKMRKMRRMMLEDAMSSVTEPGAGRVMYLVKTFERLLSINSQEPEGDGPIIGVEEENSKTKSMNWALPGLQQQQHLLPPPRADITETSYSFDHSSSSSDYEIDSDEESSVDSSIERISFGSVESDGRGKHERNSSGSSKRSLDMRLKVTNQQPFKLRTEQRGAFYQQGERNAS